MSGPESLSGAVPGAGVAIGVCRAELVEVAALRGRAHDLYAVAARCGLTFPPLGRLAVAAGTLVLCVRPERWLLLTSPAPAGATAARWQELCAGMAAVVDQSSGLTALYLAGPKVRDALARGCRLDLAAEVFPQGRAAATTVAQVATVVAALPAGVLILTPASTARHLHEWLAATARPFGLVQRADVSVSVLSEHQDS